MPGAGDFGVGMRILTAFVVAAVVSIVLMAGSVLLLAQACPATGYPGGGSVPIRVDGERMRHPDPAAVIPVYFERVQHAAPASSPSWLRGFICQTRASDVAIAGFALFLALALIFQNLSQAAWMRRALAAAERSALVVDEAFVSAQRAYVFMRELRVNLVKNPLNEEIQVCTIQPIWENTGTTPTRNGRMHVNWKFFERAVPADFDFPDFDEVGNRVLSYDAYKPMICGPRSIVLAPLIDIEPAMLRQVRDLQGKILIWGWAEYDEVFSDARRHRTEFCYQLVVTGSPPSWVGFTQYRSFNGADDDAMRRPTALVRAV